MGELSGCAAVALASSASTSSLAERRLRHDCARTQITLTLWPPPSLTQTRPSLTQTRPALTQTRTLFSLSQHTEVHQASRGAQALGAERAAEHPVAAGAHLSCSPVNVCQEKHCARGGARRAKKEAGGSGWESLANK